MEKKPNESVPLISNHFQKRRKSTIQRQRNIKSKIDVNLSANQKCDDNSSTELNNVKKRKKTTNHKKKPIGNILDSENTEVSPDLGEIRKVLWDLFNRSINVDSDQTAELDASILENGSSERAEASKTGMVGSGISLTDETSLSNVQSSSSVCDFDESILKYVPLEERDNAVAEDPQLNESRISLTDEISFSNVQSSSSYELDESILKNVSLEKHEVNVIAGPSGFEEENTPRNVHSLSSSCDDSSINTEYHSQNSTIEEGLYYSEYHTSATEIPLTTENDAIISNESSTTVEIEKSCDPVRAPQTDSKSNEAEAPVLDEPHHWECEELEQSFSDIVEDLERCMEEPKINNDEVCDASRLSQTEEKRSRQVTKPQLTTPKKRKPQSNENIPDATSPTKKEKFSPHIVKSPKKYFGSSVNRKLVKESRNSSPSSSSSSSSSKTKSRGSSSNTSNGCGNQKRISEYFSQNVSKSNIGTELKKAISQDNMLDLTSGNPENINLEDDNNFQFQTNVYLRIFEDCLQHIQNVILPLERYLFNENELRLLNSVNYLNNSAKCLYFRLLSRKHFWIKRTKINYEDLNPSLNSDLIKLEELGLLSSDYSEEDIHILLELLNISDLKVLCRRFRVGDKGNKCSLILNLTKMSDKQPTLDGKRDPHSLIKKALKNSLNCVKLTQEPRETILKCLRIYSLSYNRDVDEKLVQNVVDNYFKVNYPKFVVKHAVVFHNKENFDEYEKSLQLLSQVMTDNNKSNNYDYRLELIDSARTKFEQCLSSESNRLILDRTPDYLMRFTAANVYAGIVFSNINVLKKDKTNERRMDEAVAFLEKVIEEKIFLSKKRGQVYDALIRIYRQKKDFSKAFITFQKACKDDLIPEVIQFTLLAQMKPMLRQKAVPEKIKANLKAVCINDHPCFKFIDIIKEETVSAKSVQSDKPNRKKVYVTEDKDCKLYQSVEELVINNYKKYGWYGIHDEGSLLKNIIFACFWDIIFESPALENDTMSVFVSKYQMRPLDWGSRKFYSRRESAIEKRLEEIADSDWRAVYGRVKECLNNHAGESFNKSIWNWIKEENLRNIEGLLMCLTTRFIASVAEWLLKDFSTYSSGFPDCTLWDRTNRKSLFVEVKSPTDTLAKHQLFWLNRIGNFGGNPLICHVREIGSCSSKVKSEKDK